LFARFSLLRVRLELLRLELRFWVRVAIDSSLAGICGFNGRERGAVPFAKRGSRTVRRNG
jgi:hypothetical protein